MEDAPLVTAATVIRALREVRIGLAGQDESYLTDQIAKQLRAQNLPARTEYRFGPHCRADVWIDGVVVEVKKRRPARAELVAQLERYAAQATCREIVVVLERSVRLTSTIKGKPVHVVSLNSLWGVAL
ncbi:hypothetical protein G3N98_00585 [Burkholderia sp. Tr-20390]|nr:hypothetical protein [Burkholderia sp. Tr-20390]